VHSFLSLGHLHIPVFGVFAAAGLMCAMALGLRTARMARVDPDGLWDAEMVTVLSAFVLSRLLLVLENVRTFAKYPVLLLELPSLTFGGLAWTAIVAVAYVRHRRLPLLNVLDAVAPCGALLGAFLSLGRLVEGTRSGMPATVPWAVASGFGRVHPAEVYGAFAGLLLCGVLLRILRRAQMPGETGAWGMLLGGLTLYFLDFFRLPQVLYADSWIDGDQLRVLYLAIAGGLLLAWRVGVGAKRTGVKQAIAAKDLSDAV
jgi:phosphatidylglycerol---prolipoprotein diacylglyceryl transferase